MIHTVVRGAILAIVFSCMTTLAQAQQYAAVVMDARSGKILHEVNSTARLHPASLTKMMTLYIVFDEVRRGRLSLDQKIRISSNAAAEPPSKLGLRAGEEIELRYLIRAAAIKSANDAATAMGEAVAGSEAAFAERMTQYARAMGLQSTTFKNANGLTAEGHLSTARDMAEIGRRLYYDFPQYYNIFSRNSTSAGLQTVRNTNRRLLDAYPGADGIKTGYTRAAGFNLVSSAQKGGKRVIVAVFGGKSSASRNAEVARLMDLGFTKMPGQVRVVLPQPLRTVAPEPAIASAEPTRTAAAPRIAVVGSLAGVIGGASEQEGIEGEGMVLQAVERPMPRAQRFATAVARNSDSIAEAIAEVNAELAAAHAEDRAPELEALGKRPPPRPGDAPAGLVANAGTVAVAAAASPAAASTFAIAPPRAPRAERLDALPAAVSDEEANGISSASAGTTGGNDWGVQLGAFRSKGDAERQLLTTALKDLPQLNGGLRRVEAAKVQGVTIFRAQFVGLSQDRAVSACSQLAQLQADCMPLAPGI